MHKYTFHFNPLKINNMKQNTYLIYLIPMLVLLNSCADKAKDDMGPIFNNGASLWLGLWHSIILPFSVLGKMLNLNIGICEPCYTGFNYWLGYFIGFVLYMKIIAFLASTKDKYQ